MPPSQKTRLHSSTTTTAAAKKVIEKTKTQDWEVNRINAKNTMSEVPAHEQRNAKEESNQLPIAKGVHEHRMDADFVVNHA